MTVALTVSLKLVMFFTFITIYQSRVIKGKVQRRESVKIRNYKVRKIAMQRYLRMLWFRL